MKFFCIFAILVTLYCPYSEAGPAKAVQCTDPVTGDTWPAGQIYKPVGQCVQVQCSATGQRLSITCPANPQSSQLGCTKLPVDLTSAYPNCCPKYNCRK